MMCLIFVLPLSLLAATPSARRRTATAAATANRRGREQKQAYSAKQFGFVSIVSSAPTAHAIFCLFFKLVRASVCHHALGG